MQQTNVIEHQTHASIKRGSLSQSSQIGPQDTGATRPVVALNNILTHNASPDYSSSPATIQNTADLFLGDGEQRTAVRNRIESRLSFTANYPILSQSPATAGSSYETDLLRHFRYHVGPWIDTGDSNYGLGVQVLLLSRSNRALQSAVLAVSAGHRSLLPLNHIEDIRSSLRFLKEVKENLALQPKLINDAGELLILLQELLPSGLQQWRSLIYSRVENGGGFMSPIDLAQELGEAVFWLYFRLGMQLLSVFNIRYR